MTRIMLILLATLCTATAVGAAPPARHFPDHGRRHGSVLYPRDSRPFDKNIQAWAENAVQWIYAQPADRNPLPQGADCAVGQQGPVWFLAPIASAAPGNFTRYCTIPRGKPILLMIGFASDIYPCPNPDFKPVPGQSMYDFLVDDVLAISDVSLNFARLDVTLDGHRVRHALDYRYLSDNLYALKGDASLQPVFDSCITGDWQPAVVNGYFMMFKPLRPGLHTIVRNSIGGDTGALNSFTYFIEVK